MQQIRKLTIGTDYKNNAMHYVVGHQVLGKRYTVVNILQKVLGSQISYEVYIQRENNEIVLWKDFNSNMPISIEYNIDFE